MFGVKSGVMFAVRCMMRDNPFLFLSILFCGANIFFAYIIMLAEAPTTRGQIIKDMGNGDLSDIFNCFWFSVGSEHAY